MKSLRALVTGCMLLISTGIFSGCATTGYDAGDIQPSENNDRGDMTTAEKIGMWMWWPLQYGIYYGCEALANGR